jgi:excisionase family DNA binding protein
MTASKTAPAPLLVTVADAARQLGISVRTIYELMSAGELASIKLRPSQQGGRRIEQAEIDAYIKRNRVRSGP